MYIKLAKSFIFLSFSANNYVKKCVIIIQESITKIVLVKKKCILVQKYTQYSHLLSPQSHENDHYYCGAAPHF